MINSIKKKLEFFLNSIGKQKIDILFKNEKQQVDILSTMSPKASKGDSYNEEGINLEMVNMNKKHPFLILSNSPWPFFFSFFLFFFLVSFVSFLHNTFSPFIYIFFLGFIILLFFWWWDVSIEGIFVGETTLEVRTMFLVSFFFFIVSEIFFFLSIFWSYFNFSLGVNAQLGSVWPPFFLYELLVEHAGLISLMNMVLIGSSITVSLAYFFFLIGFSFFSIFFYFLTIILGLYFTFLQYVEYDASLLSFSDSSFGSVLYILTGFHGLHVIIGNLFLIFSFLRICFNHFQIEHSIGFVLSIFYWHFVDIIWLFVYSLEYVVIFGSHFELSSLFLELVFNPDLAYLLINQNDALEFGGVNLLIPSVNETGNSNSVNHEKRTLIESQFIENTNTKKKEGVISNLNDLDLELEEEHEEEKNKKKKKSRFSVEQKFIMFVTELIFAGVFHYYIVYFFVSFFSKPSKNQKKVTFESDSSDSDDDFGLKDLFKEEFDQSNFDDSDSD